MGAKLYSLLVSCDEVWGTMNSASSSATRNTMTMTTCEEIWEFAFRRQEPSSKQIGKASTSPSNSLNLKP